MSYSITLLSVVPVRHSPSNRSEQVTQLLFGEIVEKLDLKGKLWTKVRCTWDNCIGWVQSSQVTSITNTELELFTRQFAYCLDLFQPLRSDDDVTPITIGSRLPDFDGLKFRFNNKNYFYSGQAVFPEYLEQKPEILIKIALRYLNAPFMWGGRSPLGIDSAGFIQLVFKFVGILLPREAGMQVLQGKAVDFIEQSEPGDVAFFENNVGNITHTGLILPDKKIIHVAEKVRIDSVDHYGIFNHDTECYSHRLRVINRILSLEKAGENGLKTDIKVTVNQIALFE
jgi:gamma-D-glutamyl-L-lysine dipeptidyl-peptidase